MNVLMVRHAQSQGNVSGKYSSAEADSLSTQGQMQALSLADNLKSWTFDKIIVSPFGRALETISPYLVATHQQAQIWPELGEGCWHGQREEPSESWKARSVILPSAFTHLFAYRNREAISPIPHAETFGEGLRRVHSAFDLLQKMTPSSTASVLMVTHGHFIREIINLMLATRNSVQFTQVNCGMTLMSFNGVWNMEFCNREIVLMKETN